jgi:DNA-3-methyladenine glycosylase
MIIEKKFYLDDDVVQVAQNLIGKLLYTGINGTLTGGIIVETEAYRGATDRASHAYPGKKTSRNRIMFEEGGKAYVYMIYGIHYLFNIVTNKAQMADAVLIRALEPVVGFETMKKRRDKSSYDRITSGPGSLSKALGIDLNLYGADLSGDKVWLEHPAETQYGIDIVKTTRIGIDYAGKDAELPWRFYIKNNPWVSKTLRNCRSKFKN